MKYSVIECINGNFILKSEHDTKESAFVKFHDECTGLWNAPDVEKATVKVVDEQLDCVEGKMEVIAHEKVSE